MNRLPKLTYAKAVTAVALVLAIGGGTVYAASVLGKNDVHSRNIAPGAVKKSDLGKNAVTSPKIRNGTVRGAEFAAGVIQNDIPSVTGSATGGPQSAINANTTEPLQLDGTTTFTPQAGQVSAIAGEAQFNIASTSGGQFCSPSVRLFVNGQRTNVFLSPSGDTNNTTLATFRGYDADGPFGLISPGSPLTITATSEGDSHCTADSKIDRVEVRIVQFH
jgi:hypothetical protein